MDRIIYKGGISILDRDKEYGYIESIDHPESIRFSVRYLDDELVVGDPVVYEIRSVRTGEPEATRIRKIRYSANKVPVILGVKAFISPGIREQLYDLLTEITLDITKDNLAMEMELSGTTGRQLCVETNETDKIIYAKPHKKNKYYKFVLERKPVESNIFSVRLKKDAGFYVVISAHFGPETPAFPWDRNGNFGESRRFWENHALVLDGSVDIEHRSIRGYLPEELEVYFRDGDE